jgi:RNA polymerase sigma-70 factor (ECF subfamily)
MNAAPAQVSTEKPGEPGEPAGTGRHAALHELYARHAGAVHSRVRRMLRDHDHAQDVVQETLVRAWRNLDRIPPGDDGARSWLLRVARNLAIDHMRARRVRPAEVAESAGYDTCTTTDHSEAVIDRVYIQRMLRRLSPDHRAALTEVYLNGRTVREAAAILDVPVGTVGSRVFYALRQLRAQLQPTHADPS